MVARLSEVTQEGSSVFPLFSLIKLHLASHPLASSYSRVTVSSVFCAQNIFFGLSAPPSSVVGNALVVIDDGIESVNVKNRYQGARVSARRANREPEDGIRWKFVHGRVVVVR